jgi:lipoprotein NlpI
MKSFAMRRFVLVLVSAWLVSPSHGADAVDLRLRDAFVAARTNNSVGILLCDKAVADFPSNAQPRYARARLLDRAHRYDAAIQDLDAALKLNATSPQIWQSRGEVHFKAGHFKESVADFDRVLELSPDQGPQHWQRGISLYYAGRFADGRRQFESHRTVNPNDVENAAWHFLCAAREMGVTNARRAMVPVGKDGRIPMPEIDALYRGTGTVEQVISAATRATGDPRQQNALFYAHLYLGLYFEAIGNLAKAREHITAAAKDPNAEHYMGDVARVHLRVLE